MNKSNALVTESVEKLVLLLVFLFPIFFMTIKGWVNSISILLFLVACFYILRYPSFFFRDRGKVFWVFLITLLTPFFVELIVQIGRGEIVWPTLDAPSRFFAAAFIFVFLTRVQGDLLSRITNGALVAIFVSTIVVFISTDHYLFWGGRAATYFVDPITLPVYLIAALSLVQRSAMKWRPNRGRILSCLLVGASVLVLLVVVLSRSRTGWVAVLGISELTIFFASRQNKKIFIFMNLILLTFLVLLFQGVDSLQTRMSEIFSELYDYSQGRRDTSIGVRLGLMLVDTKLFLNFPLFGVADGQLPPIEWFSAHGLEVSDALYNQKLTSGSHSEIFAHLSRKGIFGVPVIVSLFLIPGYYCWKSLGVEDNIVRNAGMVGIKFILVIFLSSLTIQVFNLKWTSSFYAFSLAVIFSQILRKTTVQTSDES